jgi:hypothetical protein
MKLFRRLLPIAVAAIMLSPCLLVSDATGTPHPIYGIVSDSAGAGINGANVTILNQRTLERLYSSSNQLGEYSVDLSNYKLGYMNGDALKITARYGQISANGTLVVDAAQPGQYLNIALPCVSHVVKGYVTVEGGRSALNFPVNVTNEARGGQAVTIAGVYNEYSVEMSFLQNGYAAGDSIRVSCSSGGFYGTISVEGNSAAVQWINLTINDTLAPSISHSAQASALVGAQIPVYATISDNAGVASAKVFYRGVGSGLWDSLGMTQDDGSANDWNKDGLASPSVWGAALPAQPVPGILRYYFEAMDAHNTATSPTSSPSTQPYELPILDATPPSVSASVPPAIEAGVPFMLYADVQDDVGVSSAWLNYTPPSGSAATIPMAWTGVGLAYECALPALHALGAFAFSAHAADASGNIGRSPAAGTFSANVVDTKAPSASHVPVNSMAVGSQPAVLAQASDNLMLGSGWLYAKGVGAPGFTSYPMSHDGAGNYSALLPVQASVGVLNYYLAVNDSVGNCRLLPAGGAAAPYSVAVVDAGTPEIYHQAVASAPIHVPIAMRAQVRDNVAVAGVTLAYMGVGAGAYTTVSMAMSDGNSACGNYTYAMPAQTSLGTLRYIINATDGTNNISHPAVSPYHSVQIIDVEPPVISQEMQLTVPLGTPVTFACNASDDVRVGTVRVRYSESGTGDWSWLNLSYEGSLLNRSGLYSAGLPSSALQTDRPLTVAYYFWANDTSGNNATLPGANATTGPLTIAFVDAKGPEIRLAGAASAPLNSTVVVSATIEDEVGVEWAALIYGLNQGGTVTVPMLKGASNQFSAQLPPQLHSCNITYSVSAGDGALVNQTAPATMAYVNAPPTITAASSGAWPTYTGIRLSATIDDEVGARSAKVHYRRGGAAAFAALGMSQSGGLGLWHATIPAQTKPGTVEYYFEALDDEGRTVSPAGAPSAYHNLTILDDVPPSITHYPAESYDEGQSPIITAIVVDESNVASVTIHHRNGESSFTALDMELAQASTNGTYVIQLPALSPGKLEYYITATDGSNIVRLPALEGSYYGVPVEAAKVDNTQYYLVAIAITLTLIGLMLAYRSWQGRRPKQ